MTNRNNIQTPQEILKSYLTSQQWAQAKAYLGILKKYFQHQLCNSLVDYIENGARPLILSEPLIEIFDILTGYQEEDVSEYTILPLSSISDTRDPREGISPNSDFDQARK